MSDKASQFNELEKLTIAQAIYKVVAEAVSTKSPDSLRSAVDERILNSYRTDGVKSRDVRLDGKKVGTYSVRTKQARTDLIPRVENIDAYKAWIVENMEQVIDYVARDSKFLDSIVRDGEIPSGVTVEEMHYPEAAIGTSLKFDVEKVAQVMGDGLPVAAAGLLEGSE